MGDGIVANTDAAASSNLSGRYSLFVGGKSGMKISWQVTGIRQDAWANAHRIQVEVEKPERERGWSLFGRATELPPCFVPCYSLLTVSMFASVTQTLDPSKAM